MRRRGLERQGRENGEEKTGTDRMIGVQRDCGGRYMYDRR
jgi:hypothetical protein